MRKLSVKLHRSAVMTVRRTEAARQTLVYVLVASRRQKYTYGQSHIVYIGTTKRGMNRIASSVAQRAKDVLALHGVRNFEVRIVTCQPRQRVKTWHKLERALLLRFRGRYGKVPLLNKHGSKLQKSEEFDYFTRSRLNKVLDGLEG